MTRNNNMVFIHGIMQRSGTNYLHDLLTIHPDCKSVQEIGIWEDFVVHHSNYITKYINRIQHTWNSDDAKERNFNEFMLNGIGNSFIEYLQKNIDSEYIVTKTPTVVNINNFFNLFPSSYLIFIVRDGRSVAESIVKGFKWKYETAFRVWAKLAKEFIEFDKKHQSSKKNYILIKYEDLYENNENEMKKILNFLCLDVEFYDFKAAEQLNLKGSSFLNYKNNKVNWQARAKTENFNPIDRWVSWDDKLLARFDYLAGDCLEYFGYKRDPKTIELNSESIYKINNTFLNLKWNCKELIRPYYEEYTWKRKKKRNVKSRDS